MIIKKIRIKIIMYILKQIILNNYLNQKYRKLKKIIKLLIMKI